MKQIREAFVEVVKEEEMVGAEGGMGEGRLQIGASVQEQSGWKKKNHCKGGCGVFG